jgi:hypothetical protein
MSATQSEYKRLKRRLTFRRNRLKQTVAALRTDPFSIVKQTLVVHEAGQLVKEVDYAEGIFEQTGYPDLWNHWIVSKKDAQWQITRHTIK